MPNFVAIDQTVAAIWRFFKMATAAILDFQNVEILGAGRVKRVKMCHHAKFRDSWSNYS